MSESYFKVSLWKGLKIVDRSFQHKIEGEVINLISSDSNMEEIIDYESIAYEICSDSRIKANILSP